MEKKDLRKLRELLVKFRNYLAEQETCEAEDDAETVQSMIYLVEDYEYEVF